LKELAFKSPDSALDYVEKYFSIGELQKNSAFIGVIRFKEEGKQPIYAVEINMKSGILFKKVQRETVLGSPHPDLGEEIEVGDLVIWGFDREVEDQAAGWVIEKLEPTLNLQTNDFQKQTKKNNRVFTESDFTISTLIFANFLICRFDEEIVREKYIEKVVQMNDLKSRYEELGRLTSESDISSYSFDAKKLQTDILNSNMIYRFEENNWVLESSYRALEKFGDFGPMHGQHIMYPQTEGVGLKNGYFVFRESTDGEGYSIEFYTRKTKEMFGRTVVFNFNPLQQVTDNLQSRMMSCCRKNGLPMITNWDPIIITMSKGAQHLNSIETVDGLSSHLSLDYIQKCDFKNASEL